MKKLLLTLFIIIALTHPRIICNQSLEHQEVTLKDIFLTRHIQSQEELDNLNQKCRDLDLALSFETDAQGNRIAHLDIRGIDFLIPQKLLEQIYNTLSQNNPYHNMVATVRPLKKDFSICPEEISTIASRLVYCHGALEKLIGSKFPVSKTPNIAICCSGGGIRATLSTAGFMKGLDDIGALDTVSYMAGLSGSTWAIGSWMLDPNNFDLFYGELIERIVSGFFNKSLEQRLQEIMTTLPNIAEYFLKKLIFKEIPSIIDVYGYCLALTLLDHNLVTADYFSIDLADQQHFLSNRRPFPLYTAVIPHEDAVHYSWLAFSPFEVSCCELKSAVKTWAYGREFNKGVSVNNAPPMTLGFLMGLWGSAVSVSFEEVYMMMLDNLEPKSIFAPLKYLAQSTLVGNMRFFPAEIRNMNYNLTNMPLSNVARTTVVDAGIHFNLPLPPLLHPERDIDIIIICDASTNVLGAPELKRAEEWARENDMEFPYINYIGITDRNFTVFDDGPDHPEIPIVIYVPMVKNPNYALNFDPQDFLDATSFMNTFNFNYTKQEALAVGGLMQQSVHDLKNSLIRVIKRVIARKK